MGLFDGMLKDSESLFMNEMELDYDYVPRIIKFRETQQQHIATCIKPLFQDRNGSHLLISGSPGIGKTVAVKKVFEDLEQETTNIIPIYVNCWKKDTFYKIILHICEKIGYKWVHNKKSDELFREVCKILNKKKVVFCFDEIDKLEEQSILYQILEDVYKKTIILITNEKDWLVKLDQRIRSRMIPEILPFEPYNYDETKGILEQRRESAFTQGVWSEDAFEKVVEKTSEVQDIRVGLFLLREAGNIAEMRSSRKIETADVQKAIDKIGTSFDRRNLKELGEEDKFILDIVKKNPEIGMSILYEFYKDKFNKSYRTLQRKVKDLKEAGLVSIKEETTKKGGQASLISSASRKLTEF